VIRDFKVILTILEVIVKNLNNLSSKEAYRLSTFFWNYSSLDKNSIDKLKGSDIAAKDI
jgi:hypothetical protein